MNTSSTGLATCVPVVTSPLSVVRAAQFSWPTHKRLRGDAEGPLLADNSLMYPTLARCSREGQATV